VSLPAVTAVGVSSAGSGPKIALPIAAQSLLVRIGLDFWAVSKSRLFSRRLIMISASACTSFILSSAQITIANRRQPIDRSIRPLRKSRFVAFVVTQAAITVHVDNDILFEDLAKIHRQFNDLSHGFDPRR
jgi:hypothetical protein